MPKLKIWYYTTIMTEDSVETVTKEVDYGE
jgi:hypothetical protein